MKHNFSALFFLLFSTVSLPAAAQSDADLANLRLPAGFTIDVFADDVTNARSMAAGSGGTIFVSTRSDGRVYAIRPDAAADNRVVTLAEDLRTPNGIAFFDGDLYVAETRRLIRFVDIEARLDEAPDYEVLDESFPTEQHHGWRYIEFGPDGKLYMSIGAPCNVCDREEFAVIQRMNPDGSGKETIAHGIRNSVGFEFHPETGDLWFTDNGRDMLGDDLPPGELNHLSREGLHFGFPFCHGGEVVDPEFGNQRGCDEFEAPVRKLGPHVAPLGLEIYDGDMFPEEFRGAAFIAEHGSWNRSKKIGYRLTVVRLEDGRALDYDVFADGWLQGEAVSGRPVDLLILDDGSLLVSDDFAGRIYRISYAEPVANASRPVA
ncbi:MAG: PQQ-dependent sugar dehydrogenase, partial [Pseudomonadota bacterium]